MSLFSHVSAPLNTMANSPDFIEARMGEAVISDCETDVFAAVCQFAYEAEYEDPDKIPRLHKLEGGPCCKCSTSATIFISP